MLKAAGELVDLPARVAELGSHGVEGTDEEAELVLSLFGDLVVEIAGGDFASAFGEGLDGDRDLLGEMKSEPSNGRKKQQREEGKDEEKLALEDTKVLFFLVIGEGLGLDFGELCREVRRDKAGGVYGPGIIGGGRASSEKKLAVRRP